MDMFMHARWLWTQNLCVSLINLTPSVCYICSCLVHEKFLLFVCLFMKHGMDGLIREKLTRDSHEWRHRCMSVCVKCMRKNHSKLKVRVKKNVPSCLCIAAALDFFHHPVIFNRIFSSCSLLVCALLWSALACKVIRCDFFDVLIFCLFFHFISWSIT